MSKFRSIRADPAHQAGSHPLLSATKTILTASRVAVLHFCVYVLDARTEAGLAVFW
ncbi:hypothetical protein ACIP79_03200 [Streptomyces sp. NPDC088747]|uniref:hypothetical protein n=1 Tax=Streptomyces sp. NPDC088747 TaxID=3365886 RepID=UPI0038068411